MSTLSLGLCLAVANLAPQLAGGDDATQIHWQRTLEDAVAIADEEQRPILLVVNMDGESASERIVREIYKDPAFVARTRGYVCLVSSVFRHAPRDHDDSGARIECPRLGEITCGEHIALEPILYDRFLGGDRIAPRHAVLMPDGELAFDLTLLFDLDDIARRLDEVQTQAPDDLARSEAFNARGHRRRLAVEERGFEQTRFEQDSWTWRSQGMRPPPLPMAERMTLFERPESMTVELMRALLPVQPEQRAANAWVRLARHPQLAEGVTSFLREQVTGLGATVRRPHLGARIAALLLIGRIDTSPATKTLLRSYEVLPNDDQERSLARRGLQALAKNEESTEEASVSATAYRLDDAERDFLLPTTDELQRPIARRADFVPRELRTEDVLAAELARLEQELGDGDDPELSLAMGRAALDLARRRMEVGGGAEIPLLLADAQRLLERARKAYPKDVTLLLDLARTAYSLSSFSEQRDYALEAWSTATQWAAIPGTVDGARELAPEAVEALRWLGDSCGRLLSSVSGGEEELELWTLSVGGRAHLTVALSPYADGGDWVTLASYFAALGRWPEEAWFAYQGLLRFPDDNGLHQTLARSMRAGGRPDLAASTADRVAWERSSSATAHWYAGLQHFVLADWMRRGEQPQRAMTAYARARASFATSKELAPGFADSADHYIAFAALGRGFAHLLADRQPEAARALVEGIALRPALAELRDGCDREALDLLDGALEYRRARVSPVDPMTFLGEMEAADPGNAFWARAVSDSMLRESLRAEGRGEIELFETYLGPSIAAGRRAVELADDATNRRALAQGLTILGRYRLTLDDVDGARAMLTEAAPLMELAVPTQEAGADELDALGQELRERLGERRPVDRPGR